MPLIVEIVTEDDVLEEINGTGRSSPRKGEAAAPVTQDSRLRESRRAARQGRDLIRQFRNEKEN